MSTKGPYPQAAATEKKLGGSRQFDLIMGFLHLVQGILMVVLSNAPTYPSYTNFLKFDIFALNMCLQHKKVGRWADYLCGERIYIDQIPSSLRADSIYLRDSKIQVLTPSSACGKIVVS